jgi:predicted enzyme related to lactoylglutathione lyase
MPSPLCHFEFMSERPERAKDFYAHVFGWTYDDESMPGYTLVRPGVEPNGAIFKKPDDAPGPCLNVYFLVDDVEATLAKVKEKGGTVIVPTTEIPSVGWFAMVSDLDGITIGLFKALA